MIKLYDNLSYYTSLTNNHLFASVLAPKWCTIYSSLKVFCPCDSVWKKSSRNRCKRVPRQSTWRQYLTLTVTLWLLSLLQLSPPSNTHLHAYSSNSPYAQLESQCKNTYIYTYMYLYLHVHI